MIRIGNYQKGQSLVELMIAIGISAILVGGISTTYITSLKSNANARLSSVSAQLAQELYDNIKALSDSNWNSIYLLIKGSNYFLNLSGNTFAVSQGTDTVLIDGVSYTRYFIVNNVSRDGSGAIASSGGADDPSTQVVTAYVSWASSGTSGTTRVGGYIERNRNTSTRVSDWEGGSGQEGPFVGQTNSFSSGTNVDYTTLPGAIKILTF